MRFRYCLKQPIKNVILDFICCLFGSASITIGAIYLDSYYKQEMLHQIEEYGFYKNDIHSTWYVLNDIYHYSLPFGILLIFGISILCFGIFDFLFTEVRYERNYTRL